ncbi:MAG: hypothetical protein RR206_03370 [Bacteroidaceae bacterium]
MERMQKILSQGNDSPENNNTECEGYEEVQTVIGITAPLRGSKFYDRIFNWAGFCHFFVVEL